MKKWKKNLLCNFEAGWSISVLIRGYRAEIEPQLSNPDTFCYETNARLYAENLIRKRLRNES